MKLTIALWVFFFSTISVQAQDFTAGKGVIYLSGGGTAEPAIIAKFVELAGGPDAHIVVIPTASTIADRDDGEEIIRRVFLERGNTENITIVHTRDRELANTSAFVESMLEADAVWIWGGQARRFMKIYGDTLTAEVLIQHHKKGRLIGGTSSGAVVMADLIVRPGDVETSSIVRKNNMNGLGLMNGVLLDVHAIARNRVFPMMRALPDYPDRIAISIDENTAAILNNDVLEVFGRSYVAVYNVPGRAEPFVFLSTGDKFSLSHNMMISDDCSLWTSGCVELEK